MKTYNQKNIKNSLIEIGLKTGDIVFVNPEIYRLGNFYNTEGNRNVYEEFFYIIRKIIGESGTICANSYTFDTLRFKKKFIYESTKCTSGNFSTLLLSQNKSIRSNHPVFSVVSVGKEAEIICNNNSLHNYGFNSPYDKFIRLGGKFLNLGMDPWQNPCNHIAEHMIGVPYYYNKFTVVPYYKKNIKKKFNFSSFVRYLDFNLVWNFNNIKKKLSTSKIVKSTNLGSGEIHYFSSKKYLELCLELLTKNQFGLIRKELYLKNINKKKGRKSEN